MPRLPFFPRQVAVAQGVIIERFNGGIKVTFRQAGLIEYPLEAKSVWWDVTRDTGGSWLPYWARAEVSEGVRAGTNEVACSDVPASPQLDTRASPSSRWLLRKAWSG